MSATVDVIIPAFNPGDLLLETLQSVDVQTVAPRRVIIVDDGSTDASIAGALAGRSNVTVIRQRFTWRKGSRR